METEVGVEEEIHNLGKVWATTEMGQVHIVYGRLVVIASILPTKGGGMRRAAYIIPLGVVQLLSLTMRPSFCISCFLSSGFCSSSSTICSAPPPSLYDHRHRKCSDLGGRLFFKS